MERRVRWDGDGLNDEVSHSTGISFPQPGDKLLPHQKGQELLTKQSDEPDSNINNILKKYEKTGALPDMIRENPFWGDFTDVPTLQESIAIVEKAEAQFAALDAKVRARFENDPVKFVEFASDPSNLVEMRNLGLAKPLEAPAKPEAAKAASTSSTT